MEDLVNQFNDQLRFVSVYIRKKYQLRFEATS